MRMATEQALHPPTEPLAIVVDEHESTFRIGVRITGPRNDVGRVVREEREPIFEPPFVEQVRLLDEELRHLEAEQQTFGLFRGHRAAAPFLAPSVQSLRGVSVMRACHSRQNERICSSSSMRGTRPMPLEMSDHGTPSAPKPI